MEQMNDLNLWIVSDCIFKAAAQIPSAPKRRIYFTRQKIQAQPFFD
jgi:hypothetical protein